MEVRSIWYLLVVGPMFLGCEKEINPELAPPAEAIVIDAWLNDQVGPQHIYISRSQPYFENTKPNKVDDAVVRVFDELGNEFEFVENDTAYTWMSTDDTPFGTIGMRYILTVDVEGSSFISATEMGRVPDVDSIKFTFRPSDAFFKDDYYLAEFVARDFEGGGDTYWIKAWKNGQLLNKPSEINVAYDAGFTPGGIVDGQVFIQPIQNAINPFDENPEVDNEFIPPYLLGDSVYVEIHSIDILAFRFLNEVIIQTNRTGGFGALFAQPLSNVSTNIFNADENASERAFGFFQVSAVSGLGRKLDLQAAGEAKQAGGG